MAWKATMFGLSKLSGTTGTTSRPDGIEKILKYPRVLQSQLQMYAHLIALNAFQFRMLTSDKFIYGPLAEELKMPAKKRPTRFANKSHLLHFAR
jgi:hypothetical protein